MKKIICILIPFIAVFSSIVAQTNSFFTGSYEDLKIQAHSENKYYIVDFYTDWCRTCKAMDQEVIETYDFNKLLETGFLFYKLNGESAAADVIADQMSIQAYPTYVVFNSQGKELGRLVGFYAKSTFIEKIKGFKYKPINQRYTDFR